MGQTTNTPHDLAALAEAAAAVATHDPKPVTPATAELAGTHRATSHYLVKLSCLKIVKYIVGLGPTLKTFNDNEQLPEPS